MVKKIIQDSPWSYDVSEFLYDEEWRVVKMVGKSKDKEDEQYNIVRNMNFLYSGSTVYLTEETTYISEDRENRTSNVKAQLNGKGNIISSVRKTGDTYNGEDIYTTYTYDGGNQLVLSLDSFIYYDGEHGSFDFSDEVSQTWINGNLEKAEGDNSLSTAVYGKNELKGNLDLNCMIGFSGTEFVNNVWSLMGMTGKRSPYLVVGTIYESKYEDSQTNITYEFDSEGYVIKAKLEGNNSEKRDFIVEYYD